MRSTAWRTTNLDIVSETTQRVREVAHPDVLRRGVPQVVAWVVRATALVTVVGLVTHRPERHGVADAVGDGLSFTLAAVTSVMMLLLARALSRRKKRAWVLVVGVTAVAVVAHANEHRWPAVVINLLVLGLLWWTRADFRAQSEPSSRWLAVRVALLGSAVALAAGLALSHREAPRAGFWKLLQETGGGLMGFSPDLPFDRPEQSSLTSFALATLGGATLLLVLIALLAPRRPPARLAPEDEERVRGLLERWGGCDSLGYFALRRDKSVIFSPSGKAAVAYRVVGGVSLASGDPLGDPEAWPGAIEAWRGEARNYAWTPGVLGASENGATAYVRSGLDALEVGDEAVLDLTTFSLSGRPMRGVRQAVSRAERAGCTTVVERQGDLDEAELDELREAADRMRDGDVERGFSMALGRVGDPADRDVVVVRCRDADGRLVGVLGLVPWGSDGLSLDLMRREQTSENGVVELMVVAVAREAERLGVRRLSLNFAVFRSALERGGKVGAGPVLRAWRSLLLAASRWWQIESLYRANAKYQPDWVPRFVCFPRAADLPQVAIAALEAEAFLVRPRLARWIRPGR